MRLSGGDIKQLKIFLAVVECGGFTAAEDVLNISQSTISTHIAGLERRLGYRLCQRGRTGFALTDRGLELRDQGVRLLEALREFEDGAQALKGALAGRLRLAIIDNLITDPACPIVRALASLRNCPGGGPKITIDVLPPADIEHAVAVGRVDVGITIVENRLPTLFYRRLYIESDVLVCGRDHPLFDMTDEEDIRQTVTSSTKVVRSFLQKQDFFPLSDREDSIRATVTNIEAVAFLVLAGTHIGFLPDHYARQWVKQGDMRVLLPHEFRRDSEIAMMRRVDARDDSSVLAQFIRALSAHARP